MVIIGKGGYDIVQAGKVSVSNPGSRRQLFGIQRPRYQAHRVPDATVTNTVAMAYTANVGVMRQLRWSHKSLAQTKIHHKFQASPWLLRRVPQPIFPMEVQSCDAAHGPP